LPHLVKRQRPPPLLKQGRIYLHTAAYNGVARWSG